MPLTRRTPGPWIAPGTDGGAFVICHLDKKGTRRTVAHAYTEQDAALIAAAPELLAALKRLQSVVRDEYHLLDIKKRASLCLADAQAGTAIAKAEGRG